MSLFAHMMLLFNREPCSGVPTLTSVTATDQALEACSLPGHGWICRGSTNISTALPDQVEYYVEKATDSGGSSFSFLGRFQGPTWDKQDATIGSDGGGTSTTVYCTFKVWIVPQNQGTGAACSGPQTSNTASRTGNACFT